MGNPNFTLLQDAEVQNRALARLEAEERQRIAAEQEAAEQRERGLVAQRNAQLAGVEAAAVRKLGALKGRYTARTEAARTALAALAEFAAVESALRKDENEIGAELANFCRGLGMDASVYRERAAAIWQKAGIPEHSNLALAEPKTDAETIARTALQAITSGAIGAGSVRIGGKGLNFNFKP